MIFTYANKIHLIGLAYLVLIMGFVVTALAASGEIVLAIILGGLTFVQASLSILTLARN